MGGTKRIQMQCSKAMLNPSRYGRRPTRELMDGNGRIDISNITNRIQDLKTISTPREIIIEIGKYGSQPHAPNYLDTAYYEVDETETRNNR